MKIKHFNLLLLLLFSDTAKCVEHVLSVERLYWFKEIMVEEEHEPVGMDIASDFGCNSDTDTASETEGICKKLYLHL